MADDTLAPSSNTSVRQGFNTPSRKEDGQKIKVCAYKKLRLLYYSSPSNDVSKIKTKNYFPPGKSDEYKMILRFRFVLFYFAFINSPVAHLHIVIRPGGPQSHFILLTYVVNSRPHGWILSRMYVFYACKEYPMKYAHALLGTAFLWFYTRVVIVHINRVYYLLFCASLYFTHILQHYFTGTEAITRLPRYQWDSNPEEYG